MLLYNGIKKKHRSFLKRIVLSDCKIFKNTIGNFCIFSMENSFITLDQLDALRRCIFRKVDSNLKVWFLVFPSQSVTKKGLGIRMGSGKGVHTHLIFKVRVGTNIIAFNKITKSQLLSCIKVFQSFLAFKIKVLYYIF
jgi:large subunit ribosomal protein L16